MIGTDFIVQYLAKHAGVSHVFTYAGGTNAWLLDAFKRNGITLIPSRHEQFTAFAADGYARASGKLGISLTMSGPGATNLITGIADAYFDSVPVLFITGQVTSSTYKFNRPVRQLGYQETDIVSLVKPITKYAALVTSNVEMVTMLKISIQEALSGRPGPSLYDVPSDIQREDVVIDNLLLSPQLTANPTINDIDIEKVLSMIRESSRPVIIAGGGIRTSKTTSLLKRFAERLNIPVVVSLLGKDSFPNDHPLFVGYIGSYGNRYANLTLNNSDLVIALGSRLDSRQTANVKTFARAAKKIHIDIDKNELNNTVNCDLVIHAHLKTFFEKATELIDNNKAGKYTSWFDYIKDVKAEFKNDVENDKAGTNPKELIRYLSSISEGNEVFTTDVGNSQMWAAQELKIGLNQRFLTSGGLGSMGFSIPAAIGAHYACPKCPIVSIVGDGGFQMSLSELETIANNQIPIKIILFNNGILGLMWHFQNENFPSGGHPATEEGYSCPDIKKIARAFDFSYKYAASTEDAKKAAKWLFSSKGPAIIELKVNRAWSGYPKVKPGNPLEHQLPEVDMDRLKRYMLIPMVK